LFLIIKLYKNISSFFIIRTQAIFFLFFFYLFPLPSYFTFSFPVTPFRRSTSVMSLWMTTSSTLLDGGIISQRGSRPAGILIYGYCMTDVPTSKTDEHWLTKHSHSSYWIFYYFFDVELLFAVLYLFVFYTHSICVCFIYVINSFSTIFFQSRKLSLSYWKNISYYSNINFIKEITKCFNKLSK